MSDRWYEGLFLFDASLASKEVEETEGHLKGLLEKHGATLHSFDKWDDRKLAYEIDDIRRGTYYLVVFRMNPGSTADFRRDCNLSERVVRHMLIQDDKMLPRIEERKRRAVAREEEAAQGIGFGGRRSR